MNVDGTPTEECDKMRVQLLANVLLGFAVANAHPRGPERVSYDNYHVYRMRDSVIDRDLKERIASIDAVTLHLKGRSPEILAVHPDDAQVFEANFPGAELLHRDLGARLERETSSPYSGVDSTTRLPNINWFDAYHSYDDHVRYLEDVHAALPKNSAIVSAGRSSEGRELWTLHIWGESGKSSKPPVIWHGTSHSREWVSTMVS
jgi:carboxypeptidase A4